LPATPGRSGICVNPVKWLCCRPPLLCGYYVAIRRYPVVPGRNFRCLAIVLPYVSLLFCDRSLSGPASSTASSCSPGATPRMPASRLFRLRRRRPVLPASPGRRPRRAGSAVAR
jgi:hypothetical protein